MMKGMVMQVAFVKPVLIGLALFAVPLAANAQCYPECREGFACRDGICVSPCNPTCAAGEVCTREGRCIPSSEPIAPAAAIAAAAVPVASYPSSAPALDPNGRRQFKNYQGMHSSGTALIIVGILGMGTAIGLAAAAGIRSADSGDSYFEDPVFWIAALLEAVSTPLLIVGIVNVSRGNSGMRRYRQYATHSSGPRFSLSPTALRVLF